MSVAMVRTLLVKKRFELLHTAEIHQGGDESWKKSKAAIADPLLAEYADRINAYQRRGENEKSIWTQYCDETNEGVKDPAQHQPENFERFLHQSEQV